MPSLEILRRYAESTMHAVVRQIFRRLASLDPVEEENKLSNTASESSEELKMNVQSHGTSTPLLSGAVDIVPATPTVDQGRSSESHSQSDIQTRDEASPSSGTSIIRSDCMSTLCMGSNTVF